MYGTCRKLMSILLAVFCVLSSFTAVHAEKNQIQVITIGDSYAEMTFEDTERSDLFRNFWPYQMCRELGLSTKYENVSDTSQEGRKKGRFIVSRDVLFCSSGGRGFSRATEDRNFLSLLEAGKEYTVSEQIRLIVVAGGINDAKEEAWMNIEDRIFEFAETAHEMFPNAEIVIAPCGWSRYSDSETAEINEYDSKEHYDWETHVRERMTDLVIPAYYAAAEMYPYVTVAENSDHIFSDNIDKYFTADDRYHPNTVGQKDLGVLLADHIRKELAPVYEEIHRNKLADKDTGYDPYEDYEDYCPSRVIKVYNSINGADIRYTPAEDAERYIILRKEEGIWKPVESVNAAYAEKADGALRYFDRTVAAESGKGYIYSVAVQYEDSFTGFNHRGIPFYRLNEPEILEVLRRDEDTVLVIWDEQISHGYRVEYSDDGGRTWQNAHVMHGSDRTRQMIRGLDSDKKYLFRIRSYKKNKDRGTVWSRYGKWMTLNQNSFDAE